MRVSGTKIGIRVFSFVFICFLGWQAWPKEAAYPFSVNERDPMAALVDKNGNILIVEESEIGELKLEGIIYSPDKPLAVINGEILSEGDSLGKYTIRIINEKSVLLLDNSNNKEFLLKLEEE